MADKKPKKKFKETKVGKFLKEKAPHILDIVGDILPSQGTLGIVKNLIDRDDKLSPEDKAQLHNHLVEAYKTEVEDRDSARKREIEVSKLKDFDFMFNITGVIGLGVFVFMVYAIIYIDVPKENKHVWIHLIGISEGIVMSIFGYFYGATMRAKK